MERLLCQDLQEALGTWHRNDQTWSCPPELTVTGGVTGRGAKAHLRPRRAVVGASVLGGVKGHGAKAVSSRSGGQWGRTTRPHNPKERFLQGSEASVRETLLEA